MKTEHTQAEWEWELVREVSTRPIFLEWQRKRANAEGGFLCIPFGAEQLLLGPNGERGEGGFLENGARAFDAAWGHLSRFVNDHGNPLPSRLGPWKDLASAVRIGFARLIPQARTSATDTVEVFSPYSLWGMCPVPSFSDGKWEEPKDEIIAFLRESKAGLNARVIVAVVDEGADVQKATAAFGKALTESRKGRKPTPQELENQRKHYARLLDGLNCFRLRPDGKKVQSEGDLSPELVEATGLAGLDRLKAFRDLRRDAKKQIERLESALASVRPFVPGRRS